MGSQLSGWCMHDINGIPRERVFSLDDLRSPRFNQTCVGVRDRLLGRWRHQKCGMVQLQNSKVRVTMPHVVCVPIVADRLQESREVRAGSFFGLRQ